jgi:hypothetical protein
MLSADLRRVWSRDWIPILLAQGVGVTCGLIGIRLVSTWVPPEQLGLYGLCLALVPAGAHLTHHGLARHAARFWPHDGAAAYHRALAAAARRASLILLAVLSVALAAVAAFTDVPFAASLPWLCLAGLAAAYGAVVHAVIQSLRAYWTDCALTCTHSVLRTGGPLIGLLIAGATAPMLLAGFAVPQALLAIFSWFVVLRSRARSFPRAGIEAAPAPGELVRYGSAFWVVGACTLVAGALHRGWAAVCLDPVQLGFFTLAGNLAFVVPNVVSAALSQFLSPRLFAQARRTEDPGAQSWLKPVERTAAACVFLSLGGTALLAVLGPFLLGALVHPRYQGALPYLFANGAYATALTLGHFYQLPALAAGRPGDARRAMIGLTALLATGGGVTALTSAQAYLLWLGASPLIAAGWLAWSARRPSRP